MRCKAGSLRLRRSHSHSVSLRPGEEMGAGRGSQGQGRTGTLSHVGGLSVTVTVEGTWREHQVEARFETLKPLAG
eukprot:3345168-Rhodomonas_salina.1